MNMFKKNGGFTLVELIVVIAILAILAAVAVPAYTGYIEKAQEASKLQTLSAVNTAAQGLAAAKGEAVSRIIVAADGNVTVVLGNEKVNADTANGEVEAGSTIKHADIINMTDTITLDGYCAYMVNNEWELVKTPCAAGACVDTTPKDNYCDACGAIVK